MQILVRKGMHFKYLKFISADNNDLDIFSSVHSIN